MSTSSHTRSLSRSGTLTSASSLSDTWVTLHARGLADRNSLTRQIYRQGGSKLERARDLFEQALATCPAKFCKPIYLLYGQLEEEYGLAKRAMAVYDRATKEVEAKDRMEASLASVLAVAFVLL